jgi:AmpD protein
MEINIKNHLLKDIKFLQSPNFDIRPKESSISLIVLHSISLPPTVFGNNYVEEFFLNELSISKDEYLNNIINIKVSSHIYIKRTGEIIQFVPFDKRAWHAGESLYENIPNCNDYSIGIELEGCDDIVFENVQYIKLAEIINSLLTYYKDLSSKRIVSHSDIAPGRKSDPGPLFDWKRLKTMIK